MSKKTNSSSFIYSLAQKAKITLLISPIIRSFDDTYPTVYTHLTYLGMYKEIFFLLQLCFGTALLAHTGILVHNELPALLK